MRERNRLIWEENRYYETKIKNEIESEISKTQSMTLRGDVPVTYILHEDTMRKSSNPPAERPKNNSCAGIRLSSSNFVF
jgi:hypothetical protein